MLSVSLVYSDARFTSTPHQRLKSRVENVVVDQSPNKTSNFVAIDDLSLTPPKTLRLYRAKIGPRTLPDDYSDLACASWFDRELGMV